MWTTVEVFRLLAALPMALLFVVLVRDHREDRSAQATLLFLAAAFAHSVLPLAERWAPVLVVHLVAIVCGLVAGSFWVLAKVHFDDDFRLDGGHVALLAAATLVGWTAWMGLTERLPEAWPQAVSPAVFVLVPKAIGLAFVVLALLTVWEGTRHDLVVSRLRLRYPVLGLTGAYLLVKLLVDAFVEGTSGAAAAGMATDLVRFLLVAGLVTASFRIWPDLLRPARAASAAPPADPRLLGGLLRLVEEQGLYRQEGLTIGALAEKLGAHEYKVRQLINDELGFRNFNAFLNHYRVLEAQRLLADAARRHLTVAQVAYEVGYRSLGPFNKAFKDTTGHTPTEFRAARLVEVERTSPAESGTPTLP